MNTNDYVWVKLTDWGWMIFDQHFTKLGLDPTRFRQSLHDDSGYQRLQLHELMHVFGPAMYVGAFDMPFDGNDVLFEKPMAP
jgi:hypothetical protein